MFRRGSCHFYFEDNAFLDFILAKISEQKLGGKTPGKTKISLARDCSLVKTYVIMQCSHNHTTRFTCTWPYGRSPGWEFLTHFHRRHCRGFNEMWFDKKRGFVECLCVTPGAGYLHKIKTLPCSASNNHWLLFYPWRRIGFYLCLIFACFRPIDMEQSDVWELRIHPNETSWLIWMHWMQRIHSFYYLYKNICYKNIEAKF